MRLHDPGSHSYWVPYISFFDLLCIITSPFLALWLRDPVLLKFDVSRIDQAYTYQFAILTIITTTLIFFMLRVSEGLEHHFTSVEAIKILKATLISTVASVLVVFNFSRLEGVPRPVPFLFGLILVFALTTHRLIVSQYYHKLNIDCNAFKSPVTYTNKRNILLVGIDTYSLSLIRLLLSQNPRVINIVGIISLAEKISRRDVAGIRVFNDIDSLKSIVDEFAIHGVEIREIWVSDSSKNYPEIILNIKSFINDESIFVASISDALNLSIVDKIEDKNYKNNIIRRVHNSEKKYFLIKRILDVIISTLILIIFAPIFLIIIFFSLMIFGWPFWFWQERIGFMAKPLKIYKIRTMKHPLDENGKLLPWDHRLSAFGVMLRKTRLDEFPQLLNILVGEMSGIGPRPLLPVDQPESYAYRLLARPGISGLAQVSGGELLTKEEKNALDCWYVAKASFLLDIKIFFLTIKVLYCGVRRDEKLIKSCLEWISSNTV